MTISRVHVHHAKIIVKLFMYLIFCNWGKNPAALHLDIWYRHPIGCAIDHCIWGMVSKMLCNFQLQVVLAKDH